jgi:DNA-binding FrmR family transcriptional regulator
MECCSNHSDKKTIRSEEEKKSLLKRMNIVIGQLGGIKTMIEEDRYCGDVLMQLAAADKAVKSIANLILNTHMHTCFVSAVQAGDTEVVDELAELVKRFQ